MQASVKPQIMQAISLFSPLGTITTRSQFGGYSLAADQLMFGLILEGELSLRATRRSEQHFMSRGMERLIYTKRGIPVSLNYFRVSDNLWRQHDVLLCLAGHALEEARRDRQSRLDNQRLKDLPNIGQGIERLLWKAGIQDVETLRACGAKSCYLKLKKIKQQLNITVLFALEGALAGRHAAALPPGQRAALMEWYQHHACH
ncbi:TfoX/Sxy family DNA transformation protein [Biostraticola tofi]|uniref:Regulator of competence-specific genes n=1 Tax=Biostraticola tofi TaxID=466109 RepID=A0A4R3YZG7_9GAMM|nr:TfoX/Sxy family DNA transformation protein [Biostraticola tofi]TCV98181.1 regulator of competence-specific genes [Biostraticola tofi]